VPDRILRAGLFDSEAWLGLKNNDDRVCYIALLGTADTFGNQPAGPFRLIHRWRPYGIETPEKVAKVLAELADVDLIRRYEVDGKPYVHLPRFNQTRRYLGRLYPVPPWATDLEKQAFAKKSHVNHQSTPENHGDPRHGVGVGVGVDLGVDVASVGKDVSKDLFAGAANPHPPKAPPKGNGAAHGTRLPTEWNIPDQWKAWALTYRPDWDETRVVRESLVFRDYWHAKAGANARKVDWLATWRNWIRKAT